jgi:hypothetical protein
MSGNTARRTDGVVGDSAFAQLDEEFAQWLDRQDKTADHADRTAAKAGLTRQHLRLYRRMLFYAKGPMGCVVSQEQLARDLHVPNPETGGKRQVRRWIKRLAQAGWVRVEPLRDSRAGRHGAGELESTNRYRLTGPQTMGLRPPRRAQRATTRRAPKPQVVTRGHPVDNSPKFLTEGKPFCTASSRDGGESLPPTRLRARKGSAEPRPDASPTDERGGHTRPAFRTREETRLDHDPTASELLATIRAGLGTTNVLGVLANDDPEREAKLPRLRGGADGLPEGWSWAKRWQAEPVGSCSGCGKPAHASGPDNRPWHAFCWNAPGRLAAPSYRTARGRAIDLGDCSTEHLHVALGQLDRDTCSDLDCCSQDGRQRCRRHTRRSDRPATHRPRKGRRFHRASS